MSDGENTTTNLALSKPMKRSQDEDNLDVHHAPQDSMADGGKSKRPKIRGDDPSPTTRNLDEKRVHIQQERARLEELKSSIAKEEEMLLKEEELLAKEEEMLLKEEELLAKEEEFNKLKHEVEAARKSVDDKQNNPGEGPSKFVRNPEKQPLSSPTSGGVSTSDESSAIGINAARPSSVVLSRGSSSTSGSHSSPSSTPASSSSSQAHASSSSAPMAEGMIKVSCKLIKKPEYYTQIETNKFPSLESLHLDELRDLEANEANGESNVFPGHIEYFIFLQTNATSDLDRAIDKARKKFLADPDNLSYPAQRKDLIIMLIKRFEQEHSFEHLDEAINHATEIVVEDSSYDEYRHGKRFDLISLMFAKARHTGDETDLNEAFVRAQELDIKVVQSDGESKTPEKQPSVSDIVLPGNLMEVPDGSFRLEMPDGSFKRGAKFDWRGYKKPEHPRGDMYTMIRSIAGAFEGKQTNEFRLGPPPELSDGSDDEEGNQADGTSHSEDEFSYDKLKGKTSIRLITFKPTACRSDPVSFSLDEIPLGKTLYDAISYTWDGQSPQFPAYCDGKLFLLTRNCRDILRWLRDRDKPSSGNPVWIDAICINQTSIEEKNHQVAMMGDIYSKAQNVFVWLSKCGKLEERFLSAACALDPSSKGEYDEDEYEEGDYDGGYDNADENEKEGPLAARLRRLDRSYARHMTPRDDQAMVTGTNYFFARSWFHRMWTMQEIIIPSEDSNIYLLTRHKRLSFLHLSNGLGEWLSRDHLSYTIQPLPNPLELIFHLRRSIHDPTWNETDENKTARLTLLCLALAKDRESHNRLDKIFALYWIFQKFGANFAQPNYTRTEPDVYSETTIRVLETSGNLDAILLAPSLPQNSRIDSLPSWVPDYSQRANWASRKIVKGLTCPCCISSPRKERPVFSIRNTEPQRPTLQVRGRVLGTIDLTGPNLIEVDDPNSGSIGVSTARVFGEWAHAIKERYEWNNNIQDSFIRCVMFPKPYTGVLLEKLSKLCGSLGPPQSTCELSHFLNRDITDAMFLGKVGKGIEGHAMFMLDSSRMGVGYGSYQLGDTVFVVPGLDQALIVRPVPKRWGRLALVGHAYVAEGRVDGKFERESNLVDITLQ